MREGNGEELVIDVVRLVLVSRLRGLRLARYSTLAS